MKPDHYLIPCTKINSKWTEDFNVRPDTIKFLEENTSSMLFDISLSNIYLDLSPQTRATKGKINKLELIKLKKTLHSTRNHQKKKKEKKRKCNLLNRRRYL